VRVPHPTINPGVWWDHPCITSMTAEVLKMCLLFNWKIAFVRALHRTKLVCHHFPLIRGDASANKARSIHTRHLYPRPRTRRPESNSRSISWPSGVSHIPVAEKGQGRTAARPFCHETRSAGILEVRKIARKTCADAGPDDVRGGNGALLRL